MNQKMYALYDGNGCSIINFYFLHDTYTIIEQGHHCKCRYPYDETNVGPDAVNDFETQMPSMI